MQIHRVNIKFDYTVKNIIKHRFLVPVAPQKKKL